MEIAGIENEWKEAVIAESYLHKHLTGSFKILNNDRAGHRLTANIKGPRCTTFEAVFKRTILTT
jgi:hypothetical protein